MKQRGLRTAMASMVALGWAVAGSAVGTAPAVAQGESDEAIMVAAGEWVKDHLPDGPLRLDPHRTGRGVEAAVGERVARALGADVGTLEDTRRCEDVMDPSTCRLEAAALLAISAPHVDGDEARVQVYAWVRQSEPREPVAKRSWELELRRSGSGWTVVSGGG